LACRRAPRFGLFDASVLSTRCVPGRHAVVRLRVAPIRAVEVRLREKFIAR
jgi:hypothetical protein